jgi:hypothetical protein
MRCDGSGVKLIDKIKYRGSCPIVPMHPSPKQKRREEKRKRGAEMVVSIAVRNDSLILQVQ